MCRWWKYSVRPIEERDLPLLLRWRNSETIAREMLGEHEITWEEHCAWFSRIEKEKPMHHLVFCYEERPIGYVGFSDWDETNQRCSASSYIGEAEGIPQDAGVFLDYLGLEYLFSHTEMNRVWSYVFAYNRRAYRLNLLLGYKDEGYLRQHFMKSGKLEDVHVVGILRADWQAAAEKIIALYGGKSL